MSKDAPKTLTVCADNGDFAVYSPAKNYRYRLHRRIMRQMTMDDPQPPEKRMVIVMLNPSTATEHRNDPTVRRCVGFARSFRCTILEVLNLYAWRATDPRELYSEGQTDPVGPENDRVIGEVASTADILIAAWGVNPYKKVPKGRARAELVADIVRDNSPVPLTALRITTGGFPYHPLYLKEDLIPVEWPTKGSQC